LIEKRQLTLTVTSTRSGRLDDRRFLAHRFPYHTAEGWTKRVCDQWVQVNDSFVEPHQVVQRNDAVRYTIWHAEPPVDDRYDLL
jgi:hypothetical protein